MRYSFEFAWQRRPDWWLKSKQSFAEAHDAARAAAEWLEVCLINDEVILVRLTEQDGCG